MSALNQTLRARERALIVRNLANGAALADTMRAFARTESEIAADIRYVADKIASYCIARCRPLKDFADVAVLRENRALVHHYLDRIDLDLVPRFRNIRVAAFDRQTLQEIRP
jgi:phosphoenolpyruvate carboxylase